MTTELIDFGIESYKENRLIVDRAQFHNELINMYDMHNIYSVGMTVVSTNTPAQQDITFPEVIRLHKAEGYSKNLFHYFINRDGALITGLEIYQKSELFEDKIVIGLAGGLDNFGNVPTITRMGVYNPEQLRTLGVIFDEMLKVFPYPSVKDSSVTPRQGVGNANFILGPMWKTSVGRTL